MASRYFITLFVFLSIVATAFALPAGINAVNIHVVNEANRTIRVECCSGDDNLCLEILNPLEFYFFSFNPKGNTVFVCLAYFSEVINPGIPIIRTKSAKFPAYQSGHNHGSGYFYIRSNAIYLNSDDKAYANWTSTTDMPPILPRPCYQFPTPCYSNLK